MQPWKVVVAVCVAVATAHAKPLALQAHDVDGVSISTPKAWKLVPGTVKGLVMAVQDPKRKGAAQLTVAADPDDPSTRTEDQTLDQIAAQGLTGIKIVKRGPGPDGVGKLLVADGIHDGIPVRFAAIVVLTGGGRLFGVLTAKRADFDASGGVDLLFNVLASVKVTTKPQAD